MAQSNVAREPSMEEILASIRKIIESNEPGAGNAISPSLPPVYAVTDDDADDIHLTVDDELIPGDFDDAQPRFVAANSQGTAAEHPAAPTRALSLADVAARVRAASDRGSAPMGGPRDAPQPRELPPAMAARLEETRAELVASTLLHPNAETAVNPAPTAARPAEVVVPIRPVEPAAAAREIADDQSYGQKEEFIPAAAPPYVNLVTEEHVAPPVYVAPAAENRFLPQVQEEMVQQVLLSEAAGEQIARSFGELADAIDGGERRSLDEIAQDMLRPMLQDWLDDNLPTLVERLVREEIERVARGPRR